MTFLKNRVQNSKKESQKNCIKTTEIRKQEGKIWHRGRFITLFYWAVIILNTWNTFRTFQCWALDVFEMQPKHGYSRSWLPEVAAKKCFTLKRNTWSAEPHSQPTHCCYPQVRLASKPDRSDLSLKLVEVVSAKKASPFCTIKVFPSHAMMWSSGGFWEKRAKIFIRMPYYIMLYYVQYDILYYKYIHVWGNELEKASTWKQVDPAVLQDKW